MTDGALRIEPGELTAGEILDHLHDGRRLVVELELLGSSHDVVLRYDGGTIYCDTRHVTRVEPLPRPHAGCLSATGRSPPPAPPCS